jgi:hypothetical protein
MIFNCEFFIKHSLTSVTALLSKKRNKFFEVAEEIFHLAFKAFMPVILPAHCFLPSSIYEGAARRTAGRF